MFTLRYSHTFTYSNKFTLPLKHMYTQRPPKYTCTQNVKNQVTHTFSHGDTLPHVICVIHVSFSLGTVHFFFLSFFTNEVQTKVTKLIFTLKHDSSIYQCHLISAKTMTTSTGILYPLSTLVSPPDIIRR